MGRFSPAQLNQRISDCLFPFLLLSQIIVPEALGVLMCVGLITALITTQGGGLVFSLSVRLQHLLLHSVGTKTSCSIYWTLGVRLMLSLMQEQNSRYVELPGLFE